MDLQDPKKDFLQAYDEFSDSIFRHIYFRIFDREVAKELMQETFMKTWEYIASGHKIDNLKAFLYKTARNNVVSYIRKKKTLSLDKLLEDGYQPATDEHENFGFDLDMKNIVVILEKLPKKYLDVLKMRYLEGLGPKEISVVLAISENVVSVRINRGIVKLKKLLKPLYEQW